MGALCSAETGALFGLPTRTFRLPTIVASCTPASRPVRHGSQRMRSALVFPASRTCGTVDPCPPELSTVTKFQCCYKSCYYILIFTIKYICDETTSPFASTVAASCSWRRRQRWWKNKSALQPRREATICSRCADVRRDGASHRVEDCPCSNHYALES